MEKNIALGDHIGILDRVLTELVEVILLIRRKYKEVIQFNHYYKKKKNLVRKGGQTSRFADIVVLLFWITGENVIFLLLIVY